MKALQHVVASAGRESAAMLITAAMLLEPVVGAGGREEEIGWEGRLLASGSWWDGVGERDYSHFSGIGGMVEEL